MRSNLPVTGKEILLGDNEIIVSKTDVKGRITYINQTFLDISGFVESELIGEPHNIVRHPDMPVEAFEDLWRDLKAGRPWTGYVKNRCKNGDHYWVEAHAAPIMEHGQVSGYMSVRRKPTREAVDACERAYAAFRSNTAKGLCVRNGAVVKTSGPSAWAARVTDMSLRTKMNAAFGVMIVVMAVLAGLWALQETSLEKDFTKLYESRLVPVLELHEFHEHMTDDRSQILLALQHDPSSKLATSHDHPLDKHFDEINSNAKTIDKAMAAYGATVSSEAHKELFAAAQKARETYATEAIKPTVQALKSGDYQAASTLLQTKVNPLYTEVTTAVDALIDYQRSSGAKQLDTVKDGVKVAYLEILGLLILAIVIAIVVALMLMRSIIRPLDNMRAAFLRMVQGRFDEAVETRRNDELGQAQQALQAMQIRLGFDMVEQRRVSDEMTRIKIALDNVSTGVMIANSNREIIYANHSVKRILKGAESAIRKALPNFDADNMIGVNIDTFHKNPKHQADMLATLSKTYVANLVISDRHMRVTASPVFNDKNERLGAVAEWMDRTQEVKVEQDVENLILAAGNGNFDLRLDMEGKDGFFLKLSEGLNQLSMTVSSGLQDVAQVMQAVAQGDLTQTITKDYQGLFGQLKDDTNSTTARLREVIGRIRESTDLINTAAKEIAAGNTDLSARTEEQASSLEETSSSMEELNGTVKQNAESATQANELARSSNETAVKSGQMVQQIVSTMSGISESSKKIADIIGVIDSIAFQTNILALNAAVEAARAGEQGRGFAVVATEVRNLAQRSATAAKEIKELIAESTGKVDAGGRLVSQAGVSMDAVVSSFQNVTSLVMDIANASREQATGIEQVTNAVSQMDDVTQQNAALVEQAAAAAESLEEQAAQLSNAVAMFKIDEGRSNLPGPALRDATPRALPTGSASRGSVKGGSPLMSSGGNRKLPPPNLPSQEGDEWEEF
jgi:methyl-accepting chemotaxis protein